MASEILLMITWMLGEDFADAIVTWAAGIQGADIIVEIHHAICGTNSVFHGGDGRTADLASVLRAHESRWNSDIAAIMGA